MYGESGLQFATAIDYGSAATISQYESGKRYPEEDFVIERIASHYKITVDELLYGNPPEIKLYKLPFGDKETTNTMGKCAFPIFEISEEELMEDLLLKQARSGKHRGCGIIIVSFSAHIDFVRKEEA